MDTIYVGFSIKRKFSAYIYELNELLDIFLLMLLVNCALFIINRFLTDFSGEKARIWINESMICLLPFGRFYVLDFEYIFSTCFLIYLCA